jgi:DNA-binding MarR family transcriptional regulator
MSRRGPSSRSSTPSGQQDAGRLAWRLLFRLLQEDKGSVQAVWSEFELTPAQASLLYRLEPDGTLPMIGLAEALECLPSNVTGLVDKLEARGLIERRSDASDRRLKMIALTRVGRGLRAKLLERLSDPPRFIAALSGEDQRALLEILDRAVSARAAASPR